MACSKDTFQVNKIFSQIKKMAIGKLSNIKGFLSVIEKLSRFLFSRFTDTSNSPLLFSLFTLHFHFTVSLFNSNFWSQSISQFLSISLLSIVQSLSLSLFCMSISFFYFFTVYLYHSLSAFL